MATTINATYYSVSWSARGDPHVGCLKPLPSAFSCNNSSTVSPCHRPPAQAEDPLGDPGRARSRRFPPNRILAASAVLLTGIAADWSCWLVGRVVGA